MKKIQNRYNSLFALAILLISFFYSSCNSDDEKLDNLDIQIDPNISELEYQLYSLVLNDGFSANTTVVVMNTLSNVSIHRYVRDELVMGSSYDYFVRMYPDFDNSLIERHKIINDSSFEFDDKFNLQSESTFLISENELNELFSNDDPDNFWSEFYSVYPNSNGYFEFSRIAFNNDGDQAIFDLEHIYGSLGADGMIIYLKKINKVWSIVNLHSVWVS